MTGLYNRRYLDDALRKELQHARRQQLPVFSRCSISTGSNCSTTPMAAKPGDRALRAVAQTVSETVRQADVVCRYPGRPLLAAARRIARFIRLKTMAPTWYVSMPERKGPERKGLERKGLERKGAIRSCLLRRRLRNCLRLPLGRHENRSLTRAARFSPFRANDLACGLMPNFAI